MKLPHLLQDEHSAHLLILLLTTANTLLIVIIFFLLVPQSKSLLPKIIPISAQTPLIRLNLVSPQAQSTVSGNVPLVLSLSNGPKINAVDLTVDGQKVNSVGAKPTQQITVYWDSTKTTDGNHTLEIKVTDDKGMMSVLTTSLNVKNNAAR